MNNNYLIINPARQKTFGAKQNDFRTSSYKTDFLCTLLETLRNAEGKHI